MGNLSVERPSQQEQPFLEHLAHPWTMPNHAHLPTRDQVISVIAFVLTLPFAIIGGFVTFYALTSYFKTRELKLLDDPLPPTDQKLQNAASDILFPSQEEQQVEVPLLNEGQSSEQNLQQEEGDQPQVPVQLGEGDLSQELSLEEGDQGQSQELLPLTPEQKQEALQLQLQFLQPLARELMNEKELGFVGLENVHTNCFFNASIQLLLHQKELWSLLLNDEKLKKSDSQATQFFCFFAQLAAQYRTASSQEIVTYPSREMRNLFQLSTFSQEDAAEVLGKIFDCYDISSLQCDSKRIITPDLATRKEIEGDKTQYRVAQDGVIAFPKEPPLSLLTVYIQPEVHSQESPPPEGDLQKLIPPKSHLQGWIQAFFQEETISEERRFVQGDKLYSSDSYKIKLDLENLKDNIFLHIGRFTLNSKIHTELGLTELKCSIKDVSYNIAGFIVHYGSSRNSGHYVSYSKTPQGWYCFNDTSCTLASDAEVLQRANEAYILYLEKDKVLALGGPEG